MNYLIKLRTGITVAVALFGLACIPTAGALEITLPQETATFEPSTLPGYQKVLQNCTACHSAQYMQTQPASSEPWWQAEVRKMKHTYGAPIPDADMDAMAAYLFSVYGPGHGADKANAPGGSNVTATKIETNAPVAQSGSIDAETLLKANNCLACHAVDHDVVGPAYQRVAQRYQGKDNAVAEIAQHIREGGSGKWGNTPMPPFSNLSDAQAQALASWVLGR